MLLALVLAWQPGLCCAPDSAGGSGAVNATAPTGAQTKIVDRNVNMRPLLAAICSVFVDVLLCQVIGQGQTPDETEIAAGTTPKFPARPNPL